VNKSWSTKKLGEICKIKTGEKDVDEGNPNGIYPFFTCSREITYSDSYSFDTEAILIAGNGDVGNTKIYKGKFEAYQRTYVLDGFKDNIKYIYYYLIENLKNILVKSKSGSTMPYIRKGDLENLQLSLPPLPIQQKIVKILDMIQSAVEIQEKIIEKTKELKKSLMAELFKYGGPSFRKGRKLKKTEIGEIPEDWEVVRLGEYFEFKNGINFKREQKGEGDLVLDVLNMYTESLYPNLNEIYGIKGFFNKEYYLKPGDILFVRSSLKQEGVGWCVVFPKFSKPVLFCGFLIRARAKTEKTNSIFLVYMFRTENLRNQIISQSGAVTIANLSQSILSNLLIPLPSLPEQQEIAEILQTIDQKIEIEKRKKELYEELFKTMLNKIMSQEVDVEKIDF
jgi:type I restriction enzyme S subunit